nr:nuclear poly(A) polymerase 2-like isoform X1 [Ipomoea batatas]
MPGSGKEPAVQNHLENPEIVVGDEGLEQNTPAFDDLYCAPRRGNFMRFMCLELPFIHCASGDSPSNLDIHLHYKHDMIVELLSMLYFFSGMPTRQFSEFRNLLWL